MVVGCKTEILKRIRLVKYIYLSMCSGKHRLKKVDAARAPSRHGIALGPDARWNTDLV